MNTHAEHPLGGVNDYAEWDFIHWYEIPPALGGPDPTTYYIDFVPSVRSAEPTFKIRPDQPSTTAPHQQTQSLLFKPPTSLRRRIYEHHLRLISPSKPIIKLVHKPSSIKATHAPSVLDLLLTCRLILSEAEQIFYATNCLSLDITRHWRSLPVQRRHAITSFALPAAYPGQALDGLYCMRQHVPNLRSLWLLRDRFSTRYIDPLVWGCLAPSLIAAIGEMHGLENVKVVRAVETRELEAVDLAKKQRFDEIDARICGVAPNPRPQTRL